MDASFTSSACTGVRPDRRWCGRRRTLRRYCPTSHPRTGEIGIRIALERSAAPSSGSSLADGLAACMDRPAASIGGTAAFGAVNPHHRSRDPRSGLGPVRRGRPCAVDRGLFACAIPALEGIPFCDPCRPCGTDLILHPSRVH